MGSILIIDDDNSFLESLQIFFNELNYKVHVASSGKEGYTILEKEHPDVVLTDLMMPNINGLQVLKLVKEFDSEIPVILMTAYENMQSTIEAMQFGAYDYLEKPLELDHLQAMVKRAFECKRLSEHLIISQNTQDESLKSNISLVGKTAQMKEIYKKIGKVSSNRVSVLISGESGTGKELISKAIHYSGITKDFPFIAVNCTVLAENLLESELFGHEKGAFTGAIRDKKGKFELAGEGTILLDEISEISPALQVKLLRVLPEREFERVGGESLIPMRARIIAATNKNLAELVEQGKFRTDLYYRLNVFRIEIPPLRQRKDDIPSLVVHILRKINSELHKNVLKIPYDVMELLLSYDWIGNVRELENALLQAVVLAKSDILEKDNLLLRNKRISSDDDYDISEASLADMEKRHIKLILEKVKWNKIKACHILGISKPTLYSKIDLYHITDNSKNI